MMPSLRTFIAIELSSPVLAALAGLQSRLRGITPPRAVRWTATPNIHLTLHFLGDVATDDIGKITAAMQAAASTAHPFTLRLGGLGCFPNTRRPRVIWVGVTERSHALAALHKALGQHLATTIDYAPEKRPFSPHLTLGRVKSGLPKRHLPQLSQVLQQEQQRVGRLAELHVTEISLIKSELKPTGAIYTPLHSIKLLAS